MLGAVEKFFHDVFVFHKKMVLYPFHGALKFLTLYLLGIVFFTGIYMTCKDCFYHSTVQFEPDIEVSKMKLKDDLAEEVNAELPKLSRDLGKFEIYLELSRSDIYEYILNYKFSHSARAYVLRGTNAKVTNLVERMVLFGEPIQIFQLQFELEWPSDYLKETALNLKKCNSSKLGGGFVFNGGICRKNHATAFISIVLSDAIHRQIIKLDKAMSGKGQYAPNNFARMFYFSAVTMTTLGYGDIVPLTDGMRYMVAFQSIFGIVLLGLFLNSLATRIASSRKK